MSVTGNYKLLNVKLQLELKQSLSFYSRKSPHHLPLNPHGPLSNTELKSALSIQFKKRINISYVKRLSSTSSYPFQAG